MESIDPTELIKQHPVKALADGEASVDGAGDEAVRHQHQLREAVARAMGGVPAAPEAVRDRVAGMAKALAEAEREAEDHRPSRTDPMRLRSGPIFVDPVAVTGRRRGGGVLATIGRWVPAAVAAMLLAGAAVVWNGVIGSGGSSGSAGAVETATLLPVRMLAKVEMRHLQCAREPDRLVDDPTLPDRLEALPEALALRFEQPRSAVPSLDLTRLGYTFDGVGPCTAVGSDSVHLVYHAAAAGGESLESGVGEEASSSGSGGARPMAVSLWIKPDRQELGIEPHRLFVLGEPDRYPLYVWRAGGMLYFLTGDDPDRSRALADAMSRSI